MAYQNHSEIRVPITITAEYTGPGLPLTNGLPYQPNATLQINFSIPLRFSHNFSIDPHVLSSPYCRAAIETFSRETCESIYRQAFPALLAAIEIAVSNELILKSVPT